VKFRNDCFNVQFVVSFVSLKNPCNSKTTDGGANWLDVSGNIDLLSGGNLNGILMHDVNNGYVVVPGGILYKTNNGGASWTMDIDTTDNIFTILTFLKKDWKQ